MAWPLILVRYGEIGIKSPSVRRQFERKLAQRIEEQLVARAVEAEVKLDRGRIYVRAQDAPPRPRADEPAGSSSASDVERALDALRHTFGVVSASPAQECDATPDAVAKLALEVARARLRDGQSFAARVKRSGIHTFTSLDVAKAIAGRVLDDLAERRPRVDLDEPDVEILVEVREKAGYVFTRVERGPGGLPLGSQGRIAVLVDGPRSAHAAWLLAKRGTLPFFFASDPAQGAAWLAPLKPWIGDARVRSVDGATRGEQFEKLRGLLDMHRCEALVVADGAHEALARAEEDKVLRFPVFRPLVGYPGKRFDALDVQVRS